MESIPIMIFFVLWSLLLYKVSTSRKPAGQAKQSTDAIKRIDLIEEYVNTVNDEEIKSILAMTESIAQAVIEVEDVIETIETELGKRSIPYGFDFARAKQKGCKKMQYYKGVTNKELDARRERLLEFHSKVMELAINGY